MILLRHQKENVPNTNAYGLESVKAAFKRVRNHTNNVIEQAKREYYADFINENSTHERLLFNAVNCLLGRSE